MATSDVKLLGSWPSPFVNRAQLALKIKSVEYELVETNPYQKSELLLKSNPVYKKVPVLIHADVAICESLIIVQYIDDAWSDGPSILPTDPYDRAMARFWVGYIDDKLVPSINQLKDVEGDEARRAVFEKIHEGLLLLEEAFVKCSKGRGFFGGDNVGYIDIALASYVGWIRVSDMINEAKILDETKTPNLVAWAERLYSDSSVKDVVMDPPKLLEFYQKFVLAPKPASG